MAKAEVGEKKERLLKLCWREHEQSAILLCPPDEISGRHSVTKSGKLACLPLDIIISARDMRGFLGSSCSTPS